MPKRNVKKIIIGLILIIGAIGAALVAFYYLEVKPTIEEENIKQPVIPAVVTVVPKAVESPRAMETPVKRPVESPVVQKPEKPVVNILQGKKEGFLWVDKKSSKLVITLGALEGVVSGERLNVYDNNQKIGVVVVSDVYDAIAYVMPLNESSISFPHDYYRVVRE